MQKGPSFQWWVPRQIFISYLAGCMPSIGFALCGTKSAEDRRVKFGVHVLLRGFLCLWLVSFLSWVSDFLSPLLYFLLFRFRFRIPRVREGEGGGEGVGEGERRVLYV